MFRCRSSLMHRRLLCSWGLMVKQYNAMIEAGKGDGDSFSTLHPLCKYASPWILPLISNIEALPLHLNQSHPTLQQGKKMHLCTNAWKLASVQCLFVCVCVLMCLCREGCSRPPLNQQGIKWMVFVCVMLQAGQGQTKRFVNMEH